MKFKNVSKVKLYYRTIDKTYWLVKDYKNFILFFGFYDEHLSYRKYKKYLYEDVDPFKFYEEISLVDILFNDDLKNKIIELLNKSFEDENRVRYFLKSSKLTYFYKSIFRFKEEFLEFLSV